MRHLPLVALLLPLCACGVAGNSEPLQAAPTGTADSAADSTAAPPDAAAAAADATAAPTPRAADAAVAGDAANDPSLGAPNGYCAAMAVWPAAWADFENQVLAATNAARALGGSCAGVSFAPSGPLTLDPLMRCAARNQAGDMLARNYFAHEAPGGISPWDRMAAAGVGRQHVEAENIAAGQPTPAAVVQGWLNSPGHCRNILNGQLTRLGVGYYAGGGTYRSYWVQDFGG